MLVLCGCAGCARPGSLRLRRFFDRLNESDPPGMFVETRIIFGSGAPPARSRRSPTQRAARFGGATSETVGPVTEKAVAWPVR